MVQDTPLFALANAAVAAYLFYMWCADLLYFKKNGALREKSFAGATPCGVRIALLGALLGGALLVFHTLAENIFGVAAEQTRVAPWAFVSWVAAAFVEELVFRGYLFVGGGGRVVLVLSCVFFSLVFACAHPFVWNYEIAEGASVLGGVWSFDFSAQKVLATVHIFECSCLFYFLRFCPFNKTRSLIPCVAAHFAYNIGVFLAKLAGGYVCL